MGRLRPSKPRTDSNRSSGRFTALHGEALLTGVRRVLALAVIAALPAVVTTQSPPAGFRNERPIVTTGPGPYRLAMDVPLLAGAAERAFDLRLFDASNREVPYLFVRPAATQPVWTAGVVLPVAQTKTTSGFEVDFGDSARVDALRLRGLPSG